MSDLDGPAFYEAQRHHVDGPFPEASVDPILTDGSPFDFHVCRACGRAARSREGHDRFSYCYGCGARFIESHRGPDEFSSLFGPWFDLLTSNKIRVDYPGDYRYDPWTGEPLNEVVAVGSRSLLEDQTATMDGLIGASEGGAAS